MDLISEINTGRRRSIVDAIEDPIAKPESTSQGRGVPKGSDAFQEALTLAYDDMRKKKKLEKSKSEQYQSDEDFSDEERDVVRDIDTFRKFSVDFSSKRSGGQHSKIVRSELNPRSRILSEGSPPPIVEMHHQKKLSRRHTIGTIQVPLQPPRNDNDRK
jgi:hypothetical protein